MDALENPTPKVYDVKERTKTVTSLDGDDDVNAEHVFELFTLQVMKEKTRVVEVLCKFIYTALFLHHSLCCATSPTLSIH